MGEKQWMSARTFVRNRQAPHQIWYLPILQSHSYPKTKSRDGPTIQWWIHETSLLPRKTIDLPCFELVRSGQESRGGFPTYMACLWKYFEISTYVSLPIKGFRLNNLHAYGERVPTDMGVMDVHHSPMTKAVHF